jgi:hypothetical protein
VLDDVEKAVRDAVFTPKGQGLQTQFNANKIINELNKTDEGLGKWFSQSFSRTEQGEIKNLLGFLNTLPSLKPAGQFGSGRFWERVSHAGAGSGVGAGVGFAVAGPPGAAIGAGLGALAPEGVDLAKLALQAWRMPGGRQVVKTLLLNGDESKIPYMVSSLSAFVAGGTTRNVKPTQSGTMLQPFKNEQ